MTRSFALPTLITKRLRLRELVEGDLEACLELFREAGWDGDAGARERRVRWLTTTIASYRYNEELRYPPFGARAIDAGDTRCIGIVGYVPSFEAFERLPAFGQRNGAGVTIQLGIFVGLLERYRKQGYATEAVGELLRHAFEALKVERVVATTRDDNLASVTTMTRAGMTVEAHATLYDGRLTVGLITRDRWLSRTRSPEAHERHLTRST